MQMAKGIPIGRLADPREIGKAAVFLSSDASSFVTRIELFVDADGRVLRANLFRRDPIFRVAWRKKCA
jgi:NAD(P)-dependent dehydrogenase (short-subunit alcohol dehydrogenase family)